MINNESFYIDMLNLCVDITNNTSSTPVYLKPYSLYVRISGVRLCKDSRKSFLLHAVRSRCSQQSEMNGEVNGNRPMELTIQRKLTDALNPVHLDIFNESYMHNVPSGSETHFKVVVVSDKFHNMSLIQVLL
jgi:hypothetical protein